MKSEYQPTILSDLSIMILSTKYDDLHYTVNLYKIILLKFLMNIMYLMIY